MVHRILEECLLNNTTLENTKNLLKSLCEFDVWILSGKGEPLLSKDQPAPPKIRENLLQKVSETRQPEIFYIEDNRKQLLIPIFSHNTTIGFLLTGDTKKTWVNSSQLQSISSFLFDVVQNLVKTELSSFKNFKGSKLTHQQKLINKVIAHMKQRYSEQELSLDTVAKEIGVSYYYLSRLFKKELDKSFSTYLNEIRINVACKLLTDQSLTIGQIAYSCGFDDPCYFSKVFKKLKNASPVAYRETVKREKSPSFPSRLKVSDLISDDTEPVSSDSLRIQKTQIKYDR